VTTAPSPLNSSLARYNAPTRFGFYLALAEQLAVSFIEQIPDHRECRDQQHPHDDAAADASFGRADLPVKAP
jgi:hypothetical protein